MHNIIDAFTHECLAIRIAGLQATGPGVLLASNGHAGGCTTPTAGEPTAARAGVETVNTLTNRTTRWGRSASWTSSAQNWL